MQLRCTYTDLQRKAEREREKDGGRERERAHNYSLSNSSAFNCEIKAAYNPTLIKAMRKKSM